ncbi:MAG: alpha/beta hydrolase fold domain-containing protein [Rhodospirillaceae bacterium]|nr:alpha/beta hydrolase fold domain-containing protein [Rhodospirillaceae bacterium]
MKSKLCTITLLAVTIGGLALAQDAPPRPTVDADGTVSGPAMSVPVSNFLSDEAKAQLATQLQNAAALSLPAALGIDAIRARTDEMTKPKLDAWLKIHPAGIESSVIDGVRVDTVIPKSGIDPKNAKRVLINAHSGGFMMGAKYGGQIEAVPLAGRGRIKVIAVDYRMAPEHTFPAASEDMEKVYRHVLKTTKPENIGIYGCSAGGTLVAQSMVWFKKQGLPLPGAIGIMCSGAMPTFWFGGDSNQVSGLFNAQPVNFGKRPANAPRDYFAGVDTHDPLVTPGSFLDALATFPATLIVTGTRDIAMSNALITHARLLQAGVAAELFVTEGLGHGQFYAFPGTPENTLAYDIIWRFFDRRLGR